MALIEEAGCSIAWLGHLPEALASQSIWRLSPWARGVEAENVLGRSPGLVQNSPHIDRWINNVAASIKTIDLNAPTYQSLGTFTRTVMGYIDDLATWQGQFQEWGGVAIRQSEIAGRVLEVGVPVGSQAQMGVLWSLRYYAQSVGVMLSVKIIR